MPNGAWLLVKDNVNRGPYRATSPMGPRAEATYEAPASPDDATRR